MPSPEFYPQHCNYSINQSIKWKQIKHTGRWRETMPFYVMAGASADWGFCSVSEGDPKPMNCLWTKGQWYHVSQSEFSGTLVHSKVLDNKWDPATQATSWKDIHVLSCSACPRFVHNSQLPSQQVPPVRMITMALLTPFLPLGSSHTHRHQPAVPTRKGFLTDPSTPSAYCWLYSCCPRQGKRLWLPSVYR